jgi:hypothetical protein
MIKTGGTYMNKFVIIALLILAIACVPTMPARNQTTNQTQNQTIPVQPPAEPPQPVETNQTVEEPEQPKPDLRDVPTKEVVEGELVNFPNLKAVDPDGDLIAYTFTAPLNEKGEWQTKEGDAGDHLITITASDGTNTVSQQILIIVKPKNKPPVIELQEPVETMEGQTLVLTPTITDPEGNNITVTYAGWMDSNTKEIGYEENGLHKVVITADDGKAKTTREIIISVKNANRAPELADVAPQTIKEGEKIKIKASAKDPDNDNVTFTYDFPLNEQGEWQTAVGDAGDYEIIITANDGELSAQKTFVLTVEAVNRPPVIELESPVLVKEGDTVTLNPTITDKEGDEVRVSYSGWMNSNTKQTSYDDAGNYKVTITARDTAGNEAKLEVIVSVEEVNRPPIFGAGSFN